jgi:hypothetical protein
LERFNVAYFDKNSYNNLIMTSIVIWRNFEITIEATIEAIVNLLWLIEYKEITLRGLEATIEEGDLHSGLRMLWYTFYVKHYFTSALKGIIKLKE